MPIPKPNKGEEKDKFISRCMGNSVMTAEYEQDVRAGICHGQWRQSKGITIVNNLRQGRTYTDIQFNTGQLISEGYSKETAKQTAEFYADGEY